MNNYQTGVDSNAKFDLLSAEIDRRFSIFNGSLNNVFKLQQDVNSSLNSDINKALTNNDFLTEFINWYIAMPLYKKLWYKIININFLTKFNEYKSGKI